MRFSCCLLWVVSGLGGWGKGEWMEGVPRLVGSERASANAG